jgi:NAD(P)-dependent dehydrogenase (short-subunit alcohol dehydrogenase family)
LTRVRLADTVRANTRCKTVKGLRKQMDELVCGQRGALVTGASSGIGAAIAVDLARTGYRVGAASRRGTAPDAPAGGGEIVPIVFDVTDADAAPTVLKEFAASCEVFSGVVNVAGLHLTAPSAELDLADLQRVLDVNLIAAVRLAQLAFPLFAGRGGFVANIGSFYGDLGVPRNLAYSASKAALASITRTLGVEWAKHGISVLNFAPGYIETEINADYLKDPDNRARQESQIPVRRVGRSDEIGRWVAAVLNSDCSFLTGETITIDGAQGIRL